MFTVNKQEKTVSITEREAEILALFMNNHTDSCERPHLTAVLRRLLPGITPSNWIGVAAAEARLRALKNDAESISLGAKVRIKAGPEGEVGSAGSAWWYESPGAGSIGVVSSMELKLGGKGCSVVVEDDKDFNVLIIPDNVTDLSPWLEIVKD